MKGKRIAALALLAAMFFVLSGFFAIRPLSDRADRRTETVREMIRSNRRVIHAGGFLETSEGELVRYTNSYEALTNMYARGNRVCEIDIRETADGVPVCAHGDEERLADGTDLPVSSTAEEFLASVLFGEFRPMTVAVLADFMRSHDDLLIITDVRGDNVEICRKLAEYYPDLTERLIIQIYHEDEYDRIRELGFPFLIYTLYRADDAERNLWRIAHFAEKNTLVGITIQSDQFYSLKNRIAMAHCGLPFMFHTVDDPEEIDRMLKRPYVCAVYTDLTQ